MSETASQNGPERPQGASYQPLVIVAAALCAGIATDRAAALPLWAWWAAAIGTWLAWLIAWRRGRDRAAGATLLLAIAAAGGAWHHCCWRLFPEDDLGFCARDVEQPVCVEAIARTGPRRQLAPEPSPFRPVQRGERTRVEVELVAVRDGSVWRAASGGSRLLIDASPGGLHAGDRLRIFGQLSAPRAACNPGEFDFAAYARADRRRSQLRSEAAECVTVVEPGRRLSVARLLEALRGAGDRLLWRHLDPRHAGLASAVLLGAREEVTAEQTAAFMQTGTIHILSISGLHVGILAATLFLLARLALVPRVLGAILVGAATVLYTVLTDAEPPAVRAMILVLAVCTAWCLGRRGQALNSLALAALVVLTLNPADLFRVGVQLSFLCVIGLSWFASRPALKRDDDPLDRLAEEGRSWPIRALRQIARGGWRLTLLGAAIWLLTLPLVMARFHLLSPIALVLNTLLSLPMAAALWSGLGLLVFGTLCPPLAPVFGWSCDRTLAFLQWAIEGVRAWPGSYFWVPGPPDWWLAVFYGGLALFAAFPRLRPPPRWCAALLAGWIAAGLAPGLLLRQEGRLTASFLAVDHGCSVVLELPSGATMLYDAGRFSSPESGTHSIAAALWSKGITRIDALVLSHPDADHYNALPGLLERFTVGVVYVSPVMFEQPDEALTALRDSLRRAGVPVRELFAGDRIQGGPSCRIEVLHPPRRGIVGSDNANSLVLAIDYEGRRILLPGDLEPPGLYDVTAEEAQPCDVLLAPHHGSRRSDPPQLAAWCRPQRVVISGGHRIDVEPATDAYRAVGSEILHTGRLGTIEVRIDRSDVRVEAYRKGP